MIIKMYGNAKFFFMDNIQQNLPYMCSKIPIVDISLDYISLVDCCLEIRPIFVISLCIAYISTIPDYVYMTDQDYINANINRFRAKLYENHIDADNPGLDPIVKLLIDQKIYNILYHSKLAYTSHRFVNPECKIGEIAKAVMIARGLSEGIPNLNMLNMDIVVGRRHNGKEIIVRKSDNVAVESSVKLINIMARHSVTHPMPSHISVNQ